MKLLRRSQYRIRAKHTKDTVINEQGRTCSRCDIYKFWNKYYRSKKSTTGYRSACKHCEDNNVPGKLFEDVKITYSDPVNQFLLNKSINS